MSTPTKLMVSPKQLVCVHLKPTTGTPPLCDVHEPTCLRVLVCRYTQDQSLSGDGPVIGAELVYDPTNQTPGAAYQCDALWLQAFVVSPDAITRIHPYVVGAECELSPFHYVIDEDGEESSSGHLPQEDEAARNYHLNQSLEALKGVR